MKPFNNVTYGAEITRPVPLSDHVNMRALPGGGAVEQMTVPAGAQIAVITSDVTVGVKPDANPPAFNDIDDGTAGDLIPPGVSRIFQVAGVTTLRFISSAAANVVAAFYGKD